MYTNLLHSGMVILRQCLCKNRTNLRRPQRVTALRIIRVYRTVSDEAPFVLALMSPVDLIATRRDKIKVRASQNPLPGYPFLTKSRIKKEERQTTIDEWHRTWILSKKDPWSHRLILHIAR